MPWLIALDHPQRTVEDSRIDCISFEPAGDGGRRIVLFRITELQRHDPWDSILRHEDTRQARNCSL